jgi:uncharacterized protein YndB with AHSA1/START domain
MAEFATSVDIAAPPDVVFAHLVTPEGLVAWMGQHAELEPQAGGRFAVDINGVPVRGEYVEVHPHHRVVVTWGVAGNDHLPPGSSRVEFTLTAVGAGTRLDLRHSGLPADRLPMHETGWAHFAARLRAAAAGQDPGRDPWLQEAALALFDDVAAPYADRPGVAYGKTWHNVGLKAGGKIFGMVVDGRLVVKIPADQATALVDAGDAAPFEPRPGRKMREWVALPLPVPPDDGATWRRLLADAYAFVAG